MSIKEDIESLKKDIEEIKDGLKRNFIRNDKLEKEVEIQQEKSVTAMKGIVNYIDTQIQVLEVQLTTKNWADGEEEIRKMQ